MAQRVEFPFFPGIREDAALATLNKILGHIRRNQLASRDFRDWLKDENLWNKDEAPQLLALCDILTDGTVRLGPWAERFFAAEHEEAMREHLYRRLTDENVLLVKYVLEALDIEGGGRLHSTHELHRMLGSYVYPGTPIGLESFKSWIKWAVVAGRVKMIGIRWGLTDAGKQAVPRMRTIDVDEFLEDEKADADAVARGDAPAATPAAAAVPVAKAPAPLAAAAAPTKAVAKKDDDLDEELDLPPEPEPVDDAVFSKYEHQFDEETAPIAVPTLPTKAAGKAVAKATPQPAAVPVATTAITAEAAPHVPPVRRDTTAPAVIVRFARAEAACGQPPRDAAEIVTILRDYGRQRGLGGGSLLLAHSVESRQAQNEPARHLFLAALVARAYAQTGDGSLADALLERTGGTLGPLALLLDRPEALIDGLGRWQLTGAEPTAAALRALLVDAALSGRAIKAQPDLPTLLAEAVSSEALLALLNQSVLRGAPQVAAFWLVREMVRSGVWARPCHSEIAFVPWRSVRLMAYRLRLVDSHFGQGPALQTVAKRLCALFPAGSVEAAALELLAPSDHLRFDCTQPAICQQPCAVGGGDR